MIELMEHLGVFKDMDKMYHNYVDIRNTNVNGPVLITGKEN